VPESGRPPRATERRAVLVAAASGAQWRDDELLAVEVGEPMRDRLLHDGRVLVVDAVAPVAQCEPREEALGDVLARRAVPRVGGDEGRIGPLRGLPAGGGGVLLSSAVCVAWWPSLAPTTTPRCSSSRDWGPRRGAPAFLPRPRTRPDRFRHVARRAARMTHVRTGGPSSPLGLSTISAPVEYLHQFDR
jgi:hypothetical protein